MIRLLKARLSVEDDGFTLIELLVSMGLFAILTTVLFSVVLSSANTFTSVRQSTDLNEQARLVLNRMSREMRQAQKIVSVTQPDGDPCFSTNPVSCTNVRIVFDVDFNGDGVITTSTSTDPEELTYRYDGVNQQLFLEATGFSQPILSSNVTAFKLTYTSSNYKCDANKDGTVSWQELDSTPAPCGLSVGNSDGVLNSELTNVDAITVDISLLTGTKRQDYRTKINLRNNILSF